MRRPDTRAAHRALAGGWLLAAVALSGCGGGQSQVASASSGMPASLPSQQIPVFMPLPAQADDPEYLASGGPRGAGAVEAYRTGASGAGITAAVIDTGIDVAGAEFAGRISPQSRDVVGVRSIADENGHGTAVAGILGAARNGVGMMGMAPEATLLSLRADQPGSCASGGTCRFSSDGVATAIDQATQSGARVINLSLYLEDPSSAVRAAIARASAAGVITVIAAGNDGKAAPTALAQLAARPDARGLVIIAGSNTGLGLAPFSNAAGDFASYYLSTPGTDIQTVGRNGESVTITGTSASAPQIAGAAALLAQAFPNLTSAQIVALLLDSARDVGAPGTDASTGRGQLNVQEAFRPKGATMLAGSTASVSSTGNGVLSSAIGDAGRGAALPAIMVDSIGRAYTIDLGQTLLQSAARSALYAAVSERPNSFAVDLGSRAVGFVAAARPDRFSDDRQPGLARLMSQRPRTAGELQLLLPGRAIAAFSTNQASTLAARASPVEGAPLVALQNPAGLPFDVEPRMGAAVQRRIGRTVVTAAGEVGRTRRADGLWPSRGQQEPSYSALTAAVSHFVGPLRLGVSGLKLEETETVLGSRFGAAFGVSGSTTLQSDISADLTFGDTQIGARARLGRTRVHGMLEGGATLQSSSFQLLASTASAFVDGDRLWFSVGQPTRVTRGALNLALPTGYDYGTGRATTSMQRLSLSPEGREMDVDVAWRMELRGASLTANLYGRRQVGNVAAAPDDVGAAIRLETMF